MFIIQLNFFFHYLSQIISNFNCSFHPNTQSKLLATLFNKLILNMATFIECKQNNGCLEINEQNKITGNKFKEHNKKVKH